MQIPDHRPTDPQTLRTDRLLYRYCSQNKCQKELKPMKCDECGLTKRRGEFDYRNKKDKCDRCHACQYPACDRCGAVAAKPVLERQKTKGKWICPGCRD